MNSLPEQTEALAHLRKELRETLLRLHGPLLGGEPLAAALAYAQVYFLAIWKAAVLAVILGSLIQVLIPRDWLLRLFGKAGLGSTLRGGLFALPGMMCTCCAAPVAAGMRRQNVSVGAALAFWIANPVLNPATLVFMGFVLGWGFSALRLVAGLVLGFLVLACFKGLIDNWADFKQGFVEGYRGYGTR